MFELVIAVLIGLGIRDVIYQVVDRIQEAIFRKREDRYQDLLDDWLDEEIQKRQKTPQPRVVTLGRGVSCFYGPARPLKSVLF